MNRLKNILILAGGDSTRFWPLEKKSYFEFLGKPLLFHQLKNLAPFAENITVIVNQADREIANKAISEIKKDQTVHIQIVTQKAALTGQAGAILSAKDTIQGEVLILNSEDIFRYDILTRFTEALRQRLPQFMFLARKVNSYFPGGYLKIEGKKIIEIVEKPNPKEVPSNITKLVVDYYQNFSSLVETIEKAKTQNDDLYEQGINILLQQGVASEFMEYGDYWYVLKYPWHALPMMKFFLNSLGGEMKVGKNVKIAETAKLVGPCFIGDNSVIGDFTLIRGSHIGKNCLIGGYSEITRSYLGDNVMLHRNYVGDSVLDNGVLMGADAVTANFRFDEGNVKSAVGGIKIDTDLNKFGAIIGKNSKIGVNSTLLPGIKIGSHTYIAPGHTIAEDVEDKMFVRKGKVPNLHSKP
ncbi:NTP transferase domain-containing protein [Candidatus Roizmanbacteria bacterium]|nr:NTP transferase domain-containing protein [Candidatus Roizmanbacteria bacterium]